MDKRGKAERSLPKAPQRARGVKRVETLLRAAEEVLAERGFGSATMQGIAQRAKAPIGSLYQFFPSKEAVGAALAARYMDQLTEAWAKVPPLAPGEGWDRLAQALTDGTLDCIASQKAFLALLEAQRWVGVNTEARLRQASRLSQSLHRSAPQAPNKAVEKAGAMALHLLRAAFAMEKEGPLLRPEARREMPLILRDYLARALDAYREPDSAS